MLPSIVVNVRREAVVFDKPCTVWLAALPSVPSVTFPKG